MALRSNFLIYEHSTKEGLPRHQEQELWLLITKNSNSLDRYELI